MNIQWKMEGNKLIQINPEKTGTTGYGARLNQWFTFKHLKHCVSLIDSARTVSVPSTRGFSQSIPIQSISHACSHVTHTQQNPKITQTPELQLRSSSPMNTRWLPRRRHHEIFQNFPRPMSFHSVFHVDSKYHLSFS